jgi:hypothetical protein
MCLCVRCIDVASFSHFSIRVSDSVVRFSFYFLAWYKQTNGEEKIFYDPKPSLTFTKREVVYLWRPLDVCSWLVYFGDGMLSP